MKAWLRNVHPTWYGAVACIICICASPGINAQDARVVNEEYAPTYLNSTLACDTCNRLILYGRNQWSNLAATYDNGGLSFELRTIKAEESATSHTFSMNALYSKDGDGTFRYIFCQGSYKARVLISKYASLAAAGQIEFHQLANTRELVFRDQVNAGTGVISYPSIEAGQLGQPGNALDFGLGFLFRNRKFSFGYSRTHILQHATGFFGDDLGGMLGTRQSFHARYAIGPLLQTSALHQRQGAHRLTDLGVSAMFPLEQITAATAGLSRSRLGPEVHFRPAGKFSGLTADGWTVGFRWDRSTGVSRENGQQWSLAVYYDLVTGPLRAFAPHTWSFSVTRAWGCQGKLNSCPTPGNTGKGKSGVLKKDKNGLNWPWKRRLGRRRLVRPLHG